MEWIGGNVNVKPQKRSKGYLMTLCEGSQVNDLVY
jgi:hypothetical protein